VNCAVMGSASTRPAAERTPALPPGTVTVTRVDGRSGSDGVNITVSPAGRQPPATLGVRLGSEEPAASGAENVTRTGWLPSACRAPGAGVTDTTRNGPVRVPPPPPAGALAGGAPRVSAYPPMPAATATAAVMARITRVLGWWVAPPNLAPRAATCLPSRPTPNTARSD